MFCPSCRYEYRDGITVCPECNETLVVSLDKKPAGAAIAPDDSWTPVCFVSGGFQTEVARGVLDFENIPSAMISRSFNSYGRWMDMLQGVAPTMGDANIVLVPREYKQNAALLLEGVLGDSYIEIEEG